MPARNKRPTKKAKAAKAALIASNLRNIEVLREAKRIASKCRNSHDVLPETACRAAVSGMSHLGSKSKGSTSGPKSHAFKGKGAHLGNALPQVRKVRKGSKSATESFQVFDHLTKGGI